MSKRIHALLLALAMAGAQATLAGDNSLLDEARQFLKKGETKAAVIQLKNLLQSEPENAAARTLLGEAYLRLGDGAAAVSALEKARDLQAPEEQWIVNLGRAYMMANNAKTLLERIQPTATLPAGIRAQVLGLRGAAYLGTGDQAKAAESFSEALKLDPASTEALLGLAMLEAQRKDFKKSAGYAEQALAKDPKNINALDILGEARRLDGNAQGAIEAFSKALELRPADPRARLGRATAYIASDKVAEAGKDVDEVLKTAGEVPMALYLKAVVAFQQKKLEEAEEALTKVMSATSDHLPSHLLLGTVSYQLGKFQTAESELSIVLKVVPNHIPAAKLLAATRMKLGRPADAVAILKTVEEQAKNDAQFLALLGSAYLQNKQADQGTEYLERASALDPKAGAIKAQLALGKIASGQFEQAAVDLKSAVDLDQNLMQADVMLVLVLIQEKKFDEAIAAANQLKAKMKNDPMPDNLLGAAYMAKGDADKAAGAWKAALKLKPDYHTATLNLAKLELSRKNPDGAAQQFESILKRDAANPEALLGLAQVAEFRKDYDKMEHYLTEAYEKNPKVMNPGLMLAGYLLKQGKALRALEIARGVESNHPGQPGVLRALGMAQLANNQAVNAVDTFKRLLAKVPNNPEVHHLLAEALYKTNEKPAALAEWQAALNIAPDFLPALLPKAEFALQDKKYAEVAKIAEQIKSKYPKLPVGWQVEGDAEFAQGHWKKAAAAYEKAYDNGANSLLARRLYQVRRNLGEDRAAFDGLAAWLQSRPNDVDGWMVLALGYQQAGKAGEAVEAYEKAHALEPKNPVIQNNLAWMYQETGDKRAVELAEKLIPASENSPEIMDTIGWIFASNGQVEKGLRLLQDAVVHAPQSAPIRLHLAETLIKADNKEEARKQFKLLLKEKPDSPERKQAVAWLRKL